MSSQREPWSCTPQYFLDIFNSTVFHTPIKFTQSYPSLTNYQQILTDQHNIENLLYRMLSQQNKSSQNIDIPKLIQQCGYTSSSNGECVNSIMAVLKVRYNEYKKEIVKREIGLGAWVYVGVGWKIKNVVGCSEFTHKSRVVVKLEIYVAKGKCQDQVETVCLELTIPEVRELLNKFKQISKQMKNINF